MGRKFLDQARLSDPGLARDRDQATFSIPSLVQSALHAVELDITTHQEGTHR